MIARIAALIILLIAVLWLPWWLVLIPLIVFSLIFNRFYEAVVAGLLFDLVHALPNGGWLGPLTSVIAILVLVSTLTALKRVIVIRP